MKKFIPFLFIVLASCFRAQINYQKQDIELISLATPNTVDQTYDGRRYSGCWGWYQPNKNKEYAICGTSNGTYFMDISNPVTPSVCAFVQGRLGCTWREMKTYQHYCYIVSDDPPPNRFQIVDMQYLPDSVHVIYNDSSYFEHAHTIWIDHDKMYLGLVTAFNYFSSMNVYSLATPTAPALLRELQQDIPPPLINGVHDMYARNDTVYASCGNDGLFILKFDPVTNRFSQLGSYTGYSNFGYNHSSSLTQNGKYLLFCDEVPPGIPMHLVDVENLENIQPMQTMKPFPGTTPHNPYVMGNNVAVVSCYQDGLYIYDISKPEDVTVLGYFDTHWQWGANINDYGNENYRGNWGAYPYLPSKIIIAQDMQNGVFLLNATAAYSKLASIKTNPPGPTDPLVYYDMTAGKISVKFQTSGPSTVQLKDLLGRVLFEEHYLGPVDQTIDTGLFESSTYVFSVTSNSKVMNKKLAIKN